MSEICKICGRAEAMPDGCWRTVPGIAEAAECFRIGYEREKARAEEAERSLARLNEKWQAQIKDLRASRQRASEARAALEEVRDAHAEWGGSVWSPKVLRFRERLAEICSRALAAQPHPLPVTEITQETGGCAPYEPPAGGKP